MRTATAARPVQRAVPRQSVRPVLPPARRRVRHEVRDSLAVMAFSAGASTVLAVLLTVLAGFGK